MRFSTAFAFCAHGLLIGSACGGSSNNAPACSMSSATAATNVTATDYAFNPECIKVTLGDTVTWTNSTTTGHTVTSDAGDPESFDLALAGSGAVTHTFQIAGTYPYHCRPHQGLDMVGTVIVQ